MNYELSDKIYPKISVVTISYNQDKFLEEAILSILNQDYPNLEYFVIDGGSKDGSVEITFKELYQNQKLFHHIYNQLYELGFEYHGSLAQNFDKSDGAIIYADALFINKNI